MTKLMSPILGCGSDWTEWGSHCYKFFGEKLTWFDAQARCEKEGSHLASVHSGDENQFLGTFQDSSGWWIGGNDLDTEGTWVWTDGTEWDYQNWSPGQPSTSYSNSDEHCLEFWASTFWNDVPCNNFQRGAIICKK